MNSRKRHGDSKTEARVLARRFFFRSRHNRRFGKIIRPCICLQTFMQSIGMNIGVSSRFVELVRLVY